MLIILPPHFRFLPGKRKRLRFVNEAIQAKKNRRSGSFLLMCTVVNGNDLDFAAFTLSFIGQNFRYGSRFLCRFFFGSFQRSIYIEIKNIVTHSLHLFKHSVFLIIPPSTRSTSRGSQHSGSINDSARQIPLFCAVKGKPERNPIHLLKL